MIFNGVRRKREYLDEFNCEPGAIVRNYAHYSIVC